MQKNAFSIVLSVFLFFAKTKSPQTSTLGILAMMKNSGKKGLWLLMKTHSTMPIEMPNGPEDSDRLAFSLLKGLGIGPNLSDRNTPGI